MHRLDADASQQEAIVSSHTTATAALISVMRAEAPATGLLSVRLR